MNIFVGDKHLRIVPFHESLLTDTAFTAVADARKQVLKASMLQGNVLIVNASTSSIVNIFATLRDKKVRKLVSLTFAVADKKAVASLIKTNFRIIKAAGGLVRKDDRTLMMYRLGKWDLPKGKLERNEKSRSAAVREVEEECNVQVHAGRKICSTWHTYAQGGVLILKQTKWYAMDCLNDADMRPQAEEDIEHLEWMTNEEVKVALFNSYASIRFVFAQFKTQHQKKTKDLD